MIPSSTNTKLEENKKKKSIKEINEIYLKSKRIKNKKNNNKKMKKVKIFKVNFQTLSLNIKVSNNTRKYLKNVFV